MGFGPLDTKVIRYKLFENIYCAIIGGNRKTFNRVGNNLFKSLLIMESIKNEIFGKLEIIDSSKMNTILGGARTKTKGTKTKENTGDRDSAASQENPAPPGYGDEDGGQ